MAVYKKTEIDNIIEMAAYITAIGIAAMLFVAGICGVFIA